MTSSGVSPAMYPLLVPLEFFSNILVRPVTLALRLLDAGCGTGALAVEAARRGETLFIDARKMGALVDRTHRELSAEDVVRVAGTYHAWRGDKDAAVVALRWVTLK